MKNKSTYGLLSDSHISDPDIKQSFNEHFEVKDASFARGRFAQVRRCIHKLTSTECAAKVMRKKRRSVDVTAEIMHEVRVLIMAEKERNVVNLLQLYESSTEYILVLEMASGGDLQKILDEHDFLNEPNVIIILKQLMNALVFLHKNNIAHLDIKPQNILFSAPYPNGEVKLCDFGISRLINEKIDLREIIGTPDYVAPEILNYEPIILNTDIWSIGILSYVLLTGYTPFGGNTKQETFCNITEGNLDFPESLFSKISENAIDFIYKLLKKKPQNRLTANECLRHEWLSMNSNINNNNNNNINNNNTLKEDLNILSNNITKNIITQINTNNNKHLHCATAVSTSVSSLSKQLPLEADINKQFILNNEMKICDECNHNNKSDYLKQNLNNLNINKSNLKNKENKTVNENNLNNSINTNSEIIAAISTSSSNEIIPSITTNVTLLAAN